MSKAIIGALAGILGASAACAADIEDHTFKSMPDGVSFMPRWGGYYVGGQAGFAVGKVTDRDLALPVPEVGLVNTISKNSATVSGAAGGGYFGYNWQAGSMVYGVEASFNGTSLGGSWTSVQIPVLTSIGEIEYDTEHDVNWFASATARFGFAQGRMLFYGLGGVVWGNDETSLTARVLVDPVTSSEKDSTSRFGWTAGLGIEYAVTDRFSTRIEYSHMDFSGKEIFAGGDNVDVSFDTIRLGASYKLSNGAAMAPLE